MGYPLRQARNGKSKTGLRPGEYDCLVKELKDADGYVPGDAFTFVYELSRGDKVWSYKETFLNDLDDVRTKALMKHLEKKGISEENIEKFVGCREKVKLLKQVVDNRGIYLNIVEREFV